MSTPPHGSPPWPPPDQGPQPWPPPDPRSPTAGRPPESGWQPQPPAPYGTAQNDSPYRHGHTPQSPYPQAPVAGSPYGNPSQPYPGNPSPAAAHGGPPYPGNPYPGPAYPGPQTPPPGVGYGAWPQQGGGPAGPYPQAAPQNAYWATPSDQGYPGAPTPLGEPGRDPRAPLVGHVPASVSIRQFSPESSRKPVLITLAVLLVVAVAVWWGFRTASQDPPISAPSVASAPPSSDTTGGSATSIPFDNTFDGAHGVWTIDSYTWSGPEAVVRMTIKVTSGDQVLQFFAFTNSDTNQAYEPRPSGRPDDLVGRVVHAGQSVSGTVTFDMPNSESTLFLLDSSGRQVTALILPA